jgi:hypothetical protein
MASPLANGQGGLTPRCPRGKNLKLAIYIFLEFLINKDKNRGMFLFIFPHPFPNRLGVWVNFPWAHVCESLYSIEGNMNTMCRSTNINIV